MGLSQGWTPLESRWRIRGRGRPGGRAHRQADDQEPGAGVAAAEAFHACPVVTGEAATAVRADWQVSAAADQGRPGGGDLNGLLVMQGNGFAAGGPGQLAAGAPGQLPARGLGAFGSYDSGDLAVGAPAGHGANGFYAADDPLALDRLLTRAERFIMLFHSENHAGSPDRRLAQVRNEIGATGTYWHTPDELAFGARVAWRNSARCIGRLYWRSLQVRDRRDISQAPDIAAESVTHLRNATNGGRIRPMITVFAPDAPGRPGPRILSPQLVSYAGYQAGDGTVTGDPANAAVTGLAQGLGWPGGRPAGRFDVLPLIVQAPGACPTVHELPADSVLQVPIWHPELRWFADLGLRWYAVPVISDMYLAVGGIRYPAAPFNGWYMCTEIGSRDLGDRGRYDQLPVIAGHMGLATASDRNLWKDRALTELNLAVLHSFNAAGVTITDHHTESARFLTHLEREERHGRVCPADWTWIVPPAASSATPVFHRYYENFDQSPNFYRHQRARRLTPA